MLIAFGRAKAKAKARWMKKARASLLTCHIKRSCSSSSSLQPPPPALISRFLKSNAKHCTDSNSLGFGFGSTPLPQPLVHAVLLHLREPPHAQKALSFFHCSAPHGPRSYALIVHILVRAGLLRHAHALLHSALTTHSPFLQTLWDTYASVLPGSRVFDLLVQTYVQLSMLPPAFHACQYVMDRGFSPSLITFNQLLRKALSLCHFHLAWQVFEFMLHRRLYPNNATYQLMIHLLCKQGSLNKVTHVLSTICGNKGAPPATYVNVALLLSIFTDGRTDQGILLLNRMLQKEMLSDTLYHSLIIFAYCNNGNLTLAYQQYEHMLKRGTATNAFVYTCFIGANCKEGNLDKSTQLFHEMLSMGFRPYDDTYNYLILGCSSKKGGHTEALYYCDKMINEGLLPDSSTCKQLFRAISSIREVNKANHMLTVMMDKGFVPDEKIYLELIDGYGLIGDVNGVLKTYYEMDYRGLVLGIEVFHSLITNLCACGAPNEAEKFMDILRKRGLTPNESSYDMLINGCCDKGRIKSALHWYDEMQKSLLVPSADVFIKLVEAALTKRKPAA